MSAFLMALMLVFGLFGILMPMTVPARVFVGSGLLVSWAALILTIPRFVRSVQARPGTLDDLQVGGLYRVLSQHALRVAPDPVFPHLMSTTSVVVICDGVPVGDSDIRAVIMRHGPSGPPKVFRVMRFEHHNQGAPYVVSV